MFRTFLAGGMVLLAFAAACGGGDGSTPSAIPGAPTTSTSEANQCSANQSRASGDAAETIVVGGASRAYTIHIPAGYDGRTPVPVVLAFHGFGFDAAQMMSYGKLAALGDAHAMIIVALQGTGTPSHWNWRKTGGDADDVRFVSDVLGRLKSDLCIDPDRVFAAGFSDGAALARLVTCELPNTIAALAIVAGPNVPCAASVPMIAFHGAADPLLPFEGGMVPANIAGGGTFPPVRRGISEWARALGCDGLPHISRPGAGVELSTFVHCKLGDGEALLYVLLNGGHTWPGATPLPAEQFGATSGDIDATQLIWEFFAAHPLAH